MQARLSLRRDVNQQCRVRPGSVSLATSIRPQFCFVRRVTEDHCELTQRPANERAQPQRLVVPVMLSSSTRCWSDPSVLIVLF